VVILATTSGLRMRRAPAQGMAPPVRTTSPVVEHHLGETGEIADGGKHAGRARDPAHGLRDRILDDTAQSMPGGRNARRQARGGRKRVCRMPSGRQKWRST